MWCSPQLGTAVEVPLKQAGKHHRANIFWIVLTGCLRAYLLLLSVYLNYRDIIPIRCIYLGRKTHGTNSLDNFKIAIFFFFAVNTYSLMVRVRFFPVAWFNEVSSIKFRFKFIGDAT